ncbi:HAD family hydrolase [uncultured Desulfobacter sp.]|uniref:HAD family hydrolase n=1 Tax=uncultured Desulfobacter sp. TaxID=240139 RepID=UPI0029F49212|nr:HAD family hydrolase [uncultured Desulfobacter sp.]
MKLLLFDLDNTLIDRNGAFEYWVRRWLKKRSHLPGRPMQELGDRLIMIDNGGHTDRIAFCRDVCVQQLLDRPLRTLFLKEMHTFTDSILSDQTINMMLRKLTQRFSMAIVSNGSPKMQRKKIYKAGIGPYFQHCFLSGELGYAKPDLRIFKKALAAYGCSPHQAMMIGDNLKTDIVPARRLGMKTVLLSRTPVMNSPADFTIESITQLESILP